MNTHFTINKDIISPTQIFASLSLTHNIHPHPIPKQPL